MRTEEVIELATTTGKKGIEDAYRALYSSSTPQEVIDKLRDYKKISEEIEKIMSKIKEKAYIDMKNKLILFGFKSEYDIKSTIANKLSHMYPKYTVIIAQIRDKDKTVGISLRNQLSTLHMGDMAQSIIKELGRGRGGGHAPAAGMVIRQQDYEKFKEIIKSKIENENK